MARMLPPLLLVGTVAWLSACDRPPTASDLSGSEPLRPTSAALSRIIDNGGFGSSGNNAGQAVSTFYTEEDDGLPSFPWPARRFLTNDLGEPVNELGQVVDEFDAPQDNAWEAVCPFSAASAGCYPAVGSLRGEEARWSHAYAGRDAGDYGVFITTQDHTTNNPFIGNFEFGFELDVAVTQSGMRQSIPWDAPFNDVHPPLLRAGDYRLVVRYELLARTAGGVAELRVLRDGLEPIAWRTIDAADLLECDIDRVGTLRGPTVPNAAGDPEATTNSVTFDRCESGRLSLAFSLGAPGTVTVEVTVVEDGEPTADPALALFLDDMELIAPPIPVETDIRPTQISVSLSSTVSVYAYSSADFDATAIHPADTRLTVDGETTGARVATRSGSWMTGTRDYNGDGLVDRLFVFRVSDLVAVGLRSTSTALVLRGTVGDEPFQGTDPTPSSIVP